VDSLGSFGKGALAVMGAIIGLAILSVILSKKSDTPGFIQAVASALSNVIGTAVTPLPAASASASVGGNAAAPAIGSAAPDFLTGLLHFPLW